MRYFILSSWQYVYRALRWHIQVAFTDLRFAGVLVGVPVMSAALPCMWRDPLAPPCFAFHILHLRPLVIVSGLPAAALSLLRPSIRLMSTSVGNPVQYLPPHLQRNSSNLKYFELRQLYALLSSISVFFPYLPSTSSGFMKYFACRSAYALLVILPSRPSMAP